MTNSRIRGGKPIVDRNAQLGLSIIEALVALFIFAVGALGLAALQTTAFLQVDDANQRSLAAMKANELVDRMLSTRSFTDPDGLIPEFVTSIASSDVSAIGSADTPRASQICGGTIPTDCSSSGTVCSVDDLVSFEIFDVLCDANLGVASTGSVQQGSIGLTNLDIVLRNAGGGGFELYLEWLSRTADQNLNDYAASTTVQTELCGTTINLDPSLDAICVNFR